MYQNKYLKYKKKYLNLINQLGGNNTFTIYTTGIANLHEEIYTIVDDLQNYLLQNICEMIPNRFQNIDIIHSDILVRKYPSKEDVELYIKQNLIDIKIDNRIRRHEFTTKEFDFNQISKTKSYIIIDFAHLFNYTDTLIDITDNGSTQVINILTKEILNLNIIYIGFLNDTESSRTIARTKFFRVNDDNTIITLYNNLLRTNITSIFPVVNYIPSLTNNYNPAILLELLSLNIKDRYNEDYKIFDEYFSTIYTTDYPYREINKFEKPIIFNIDDNSYNISLKNYIGQSLILYIMNDEYNDINVIMDIIKAKVDFIIKEKEKIKEELKKKLRYKKDIKKLVDSYRNKYLIN